MNSLQISGEWKIFTGKVKQKWAQLTNDDLAFGAGKTEELIGHIQKRTGEARSVIEAGLRDLTNK